MAETKNVKDIDIVVGDDSASGGFKSLNCNDQNIGSAQATINGVSLQSNGSANEYLAGDGSYSTPSGGSGDVTGPSESVDNTLAVYDGTTGKVIKQPNNQAVICNNVQLKNVAVGIDPTDVAVVSQLQTSNGDVVGPASSITNDVTVFADTTGKVIKEPNAPIGFGNQQLKNIFPGSAPTDAATVSQLGTGNVQISSAFGYDVNQTSNYLNTVNTSSIPAPLNFATRLEAPNPDAAVDFSQYIGLENLAGDPTKIVLITSLSDAQNFKINDLIYVKNEINTGNESIVAGGAFLVVDVLTSGSQIGVVIDNNGGLVSNGNGDFKRINTFSIDDSVRANFTAELVFIAPSDINSSYLGTQGTYNNVSAANSNNQSDIINSNGMQKNIADFVRLDGPNYKGIW